MKFGDVLAKVAWTLLAEGCVSYRRIKREFGLDDDAVEDLRHELILVKHVAIDRDGEFLCWAGAVGSAIPSATRPELPALQPLVAVDGGWLGKGTGDVGIDPRDDLAIRSDNAERDTRGMESH